MQSQVQPPQTARPGVASADSPTRPPVSPITPVVSFAELAAQQLPPPAHPNMRPPPETQSGEVVREGPIQNYSQASAPHPSTHHLPPHHSQSNAGSQAAIASIAPHAQDHRQSYEPQPQQDQKQHTPNPPRNPALDSAPTPSTSTSTDESRPRFMPPPELADLDVDENSDAAALRSALAILQIQREKTRKDMKTLTKLRDAARSDPDSFIQETLAGNLSQTKTSSDPLAATLESDSDPASEEDTDMDDNGKLPKFPSRQNVVRCPPVNWAKYHVVGEGLDRMHEDQRKRPILGVPSTGDWTGRDHVVAAPYSPLEDRAALSAMEHPMVTRKGGKRL